jgi:hypothetical protein
MPTDAEFEAFYTEKLAQGRLTVEEIQSVVNERWRDREDRMSYINWYLNRKKWELPKPAPDPPAPLIDMIANTNYNNALQRTQLDSAMLWAMGQGDSRGCIPVGRDWTGEIYRIIPRMYDLVADKPSPTTSRQLVSGPVLGVNTNVHPGKASSRRQQNLSDESSASNESDDCQIGGFVFHQLGNLESFCGESRTLKDLTDEEQEENWESTPFYAVIRFGSSGAYEGIYLMYDWHWPNLGEYRNGNRRSENGHWGYLGGVGDRVQFSCAKIADNLHELGFEHTFQRTEVISYPVEIVRAVHTMSGTIIRATITETSLKHQEELSKVEEMDEGSSDF